MTEKVCALCGRKFLTHYPKKQIYCSTECSYEKMRQSQQKYNEKNSEEIKVKQAARRKTNAEKKARKKYNSDSLSEFVAELERVNKQRREVGKPPLSYGYYRAIVDGRIKPR